MEQNIRTDLALEVSERFQEDNVEVEGVVLIKDYDKKTGIKVSVVEIKNKKGATAMERDIGTYITIEDTKLDAVEEEYNTSLCKVVIKNLKKLIKDKDIEDVLIVGLGNREVTPDALGPNVVDNLFVTRHLIKEFGQEFKDEHKLRNVSAISPGVMAQTGMEALEIIKGIVDQIHPQLIIVIDALASRSIHRLNTTIQLTDTGISPGSGVGNNRKALNKETVGVDVIALGVPTVVDAITIVSDIMDGYMRGLGIDENDIYHFMEEVNKENIKNMFVTPKDIDESMKRMSFTISEALNGCFPQEKHITKVF